MIIGPDGQEIAPPQLKPQPKPEAHDTAPPKHASASSGAHGTTDSSGSASFNRAVQQARAERAAADGLPPWAHGYETGTLARQGDTFWGIATAHGDTLPVEEKDNAQIPDPNLIYPGEIIFSPGKSPVSASTTQAIEAAEQSGTKQAWAKAEAGIAKDLETQGANRLAPDKVVQPTVHALDQWAVGNDKLQEATQKAYQQAYQGWKEQGITSQQIAPILKDRAAAVQDDEAPAHLHGAQANRAIVGEEQQAAGQAWDKVQQDVTSWLESSVGVRAFPEDLGAQRVKELDALFPDDQKFAATNQAALNAAKQSWTALGITRGKLEPILKAYNAYEAAKQQRAAALKLPHLHNVDPEAPGNLNPPVNEAESKLQSAIERELKQAAGEVSSPQLRSQAMLDRAALLEKVGPHTADFYNAVDQANNDLQVNQPAGQVAAAYRKGGAQAAAAELLKATRDAGPLYATQIIQASEPTIRQIGGDLNTLAATATAPAVPRAPAVAQAHASAQFYSIYNDLSEAVEQTYHGTSGDALGPDTTDAANLVANALASGYQPSSLDLDFGNPADTYANAAENSVGGLHGASLSLALAGALQHQGKGSAASLVLDGAANGYDELKTRTDSDVQSFGNVTANLDQLRNSWGPFMSGSQLNAATAGYIKSNPQFVKQFNQTLGAVRQDGAAIVAARQAFSGYKSSLKGISGDNDLNGAAANLTGNDKSTLFAVQQSELPAAALLKAVTAQAPGSGTPYSTELDAPGALRSLRTAANQLLKYPKTTVFPVTTKTTPTGTVAKVQVPTLANLGLSAIGALLSFSTAKSEIANWNQLGFSSQVVTVYNTAGFSKYVTESASYLTQLVQGGAKQASGFGALTDTPIFKGLGALYYLSGTVGNATSAYEELSKNNIIAGFDGATAVGNFALAANSSAKVLDAVGLISAGDTASNLLDVAGPVGAVLSAVAQVGLFGYVAYKQDSADHAMESQGTTFLEDGLHLRPNIASAAADVSDPSHEGPAPALLAYARQYHIDPQSLLLALNKQNPVDVQNFVHFAEVMPRDSNGHYRAISSSDTSNLFYKHGVSWLQNEMLWQQYQMGAMETAVPGQKPKPLQQFPMPQSLRQLHYWYETMFGDNRSPTS